MGAARFLWVDDPLRVRSTAGGSRRSLPRVRTVRVLSLLGCLVASTWLGCADNPCADALDKLEDCGVSGGRDPEVDEECQDTAACTAQCINEVECEDIASPTPDGVFTQCVNSCSALSDG